MNFRRFSFTSEPLENEIDAAFKNIYPSPQKLEIKCEESLKDSFTMRTNKMEVNEKKRLVGIRSKVSGSRSIKEVLDSLPSNYFTPQYDPIVSHLLEISSWNENDITQKFMSKIEESDNSKDIIVSHMTSMIDASYDELMGCMEKVQEINVDLFEAGMQIKHSRLKLSASLNNVAHGPLHIKSLHDQREKFVGVLDVLRGLKSIQDIHRTMLLRVTTGDVGDAAQLARDVVDCFKFEDFDKFLALNSINRSMEKNIYTIRQKTDRALKRLCCRKFSAPEYDGILRSYFILNNLWDRFDFDFAEYEDEETNLDTINCIDGLAERINRFQLDDIDGCLHSAVMELIYLSQQQKQQAALEIAVEGAYQQLNLGEIVDLTEVPLHMLYRRIAPELFPKCVIRSCELLTDIVHTNFLISQWHLAPFHPNNSDMEILHSNRTTFFDSTKFHGNESNKINDKEDEEKHSEDGNDNFSAIPSFEFSNEAKLDLSSINSNTIKSLYGKDHQCDSSQKMLKRIEVLMTVIYSNLMQSRLILWKDITAAISTMLSNLAFSSTRLDDFLAMIGSLKLMIKLGKEFCNSDSFELEESIKEKSEEFIFRFHLESFQVLRMMIDADSWRHIPISITNNETMLQTLESFARECVGADLDSPNQTHSVASFGILHSFCRNGNPFAEMLRHDTVKWNYNTIFAAFTDATKYKFDHLFKFFHVELDDTTDSMQHHKKVKSSAMISTMIVTQVALNGLTKFLVKYLNLMTFFSSAVIDIFDNICQLFDFYVCSVFHGFTPSDERAKFLTGFTKFTSPPPDNYREYEVLFNFIERIFGSVVCIRSSTVSNDSTFEDAESNQVDGTPKKNFEAVKITSLLTVPLVIEEADAPSFFALTERIVAAESCFYLSQVLTESKVVISKLLPEKASSKFESYISNFTLITSQLRSFIYKAMCPQLHSAISVVNAILECAWETKKVRETHSAWVDRLININKQVWSYLISSDQFGESSVLVREQVWLEICQSAFDIAIEGFSKVRKCSPEGRAAMSMDVFALHEGLNNIHLCRPPRGKHYVDNYLRAFLMSEEEIMQWVQNNWQSYAYRNIHGLLTQTMSSMLNSKKLKDAIAVIDNLYDTDNSDNGKVSSLLSNRLKEESKFSNILASKFRR